MIVEPTKKLYSNCYGPYIRTGLYRVWAELWMLIPGVCRVMVTV